MNPYRCLACREMVHLDDVAIRLTTDPTDNRVLCVWCLHADDDRHGMSKGLRAEVSETARQA